MEEQYVPDLLTLGDDEGNEYTFEVLDAVETEDGRYLAMVPAPETEEDEEDVALVIVKTNETPDGVFYSEIEDDAEYESIAAIFTDRLQEFFTMADE